MVLVVRLGGENSDVYPSMSHTRLACQLSKVGDQLVCGSSSLEGEERPAGKGFTCYGTNGFPSLH